MDATDDLPEFGRGREGASEGRQVYMRDSRGGRLLEDDWGRGRPDMVSLLPLWYCSSIPSLYTHSLYLGWRWGRQKLLTVASRPSSLIW